MTSTMITYTTKAALPTILTTPISRIDIPAAKAFLTWLAASPYQFHIDEDPADCINLKDGEEVPAFAPEIAALLENRVSECFTALGYTGAWDAYPLLDADAETAPDPVFGLAACITAMSALADRDLATAEAICAKHHADFDSTRIVITGQDHDASPEQVAAIMADIAKANA